MSSRIRRSFYGATITNIEIQPVDEKGRRDYRVYFFDADGTGNALMRPSANPEHVKVGERADVIRDGNGRIVFLQRAELAELEETSVTQPAVVMDVGIPAKMTATLQFDLSKAEAVERIGEFLESMNVVAITVASGGKQVQCTGLVISLVPATPSEVCPVCGGTGRGPTGSAGDCEECGGEGFAIARAGELDELKGNVSDESA